jgi:signal peptidase II
MITSYLTKNLYINTIIVILIFILDRFSKIYVMNLDKVNYSSQLYQSKYLNISLVWNEGIAFGLLSFSKIICITLLSFIIAIIVLIIFFMIIKNNEY